jgi:hypothetical protein
MWNEYGAADNRGAAAEDQGAAAVQIQISNFFYNSNLFVLFSSKRCSDLQLLRKFSSL